ncbi:MAG: hypothetical protein J7L77_04265 [Clostridiales bacterium]|nr:hypothetical protein [Clostridiales bacterium]
MIKKVVVIILLSVILVMMLSGCIPGDEKATVEKPANFLWGIWHGWLAPLSLIISLFNKSIRVYESINTGWWYDFGFYIAIISGFGGLSIFRHKKRPRDND